MPTFEEIYAKMPGEYEELVSFEDARGELRSFLQELCSPADSLVAIEAGIGTGRLTRLYARFCKEIHGYDRSPAMIEYSKKLLDGLPVQLGVADNLALPYPGEAPRCDLFIEGWSFGHTVHDHSEDVFKTVDALVSQAEKFTREGGHIVFIETLGTFQPYPRAPSFVLGLMYQTLEEKHGFHRYELRTDFMFPTLEEAVHRVRFFFGDSMAEAIRNSSSPQVMEWTGAWVKTR